MKLQRPLVSIDTEATGPAPEFDRVIEVGLVTQHPNGSSSESRWLINPGRSIPADATAVSTTDWQDIQTELSQTNVCGERNAMIRAVYAMSVGRVDDAVGMLAWFRGHSNHEWFVEVRGERAAKGGA